jgi:hypothetical protein
MNVITSRQESLTQQRVEASTQLQGNSSHGGEPEQIGIGVGRCKEKNYSGGLTLLCRLEFLER